MAYLTLRQRRRPEIDPVSGQTKARLKRTLGYDLDERKCPTVMYLIDDDDPDNPGGLDLELWAEENDPACHPDGGGMANPTSLAARTNLSTTTVVNSVLSMCHVHEVGPVRITTVQSFDAGYAQYRAKDRRRR
jgi:hypothetical protein